MDAVLTESPFFDFGEDPLYPFARTGLRHIDGDSPETLRAQVRQFAPKEPGVYGMLDVQGRVIYVGKSKLLRNRLLSYFLPNNEEDKAGRIVQSSVSIVWETQPSEFAALVREQALIRQFQPRFNVQGIPRRQQPVFVCLGRQPAEQFYTARQHEHRALTSIGPLFGASRAGRAVEVLNRVYKLRDCSSKQPCSFTDQLQLFDIDMRPGCIRLEIQSCLGPCISGCSRKDYQYQVDLAGQFLDGSDDRPVHVLQTQMEQAAKNLHFEQAMVLRDDLQAVTWLHRRAQDLSTAREHYTFVYPVAGIAPARPQAASQDVWYLIRHGIIEGAMAAPRNITEKRRATAQVRRWLKQDQLIGASFAPRPETLALVSSWFRKHRAELKQTFLPKITRATKTTGAPKSTSSVSSRRRRTSAASPLPAVKV